MINAASRSALAVVNEELERTIASADVDSLDSLATELYQVAELLVANPRLRRTLGDASTAPESRNRLVDTLFSGKVGAGTLDVLHSVVGARWSNPWDMTDGLAIAGDTVLLGAADRRGVLDEVEDELFRFGRIVRSQDELRGLLDDQGVSADRRAALLADVLGTKVNKVTAELLTHGVRSGRKRTIELAIDDLMELTATRRGQSVAEVTSAAPLTDAQIDRLSTTLTRIYGRTITVRPQVDPKVLGGLVIRVGNELIDGSVSTRLAEVRTALTS